MLGFNIAYSDYAGSWKHPTSFVERSTTKDTKKGSPTPSNKKHRRSSLSRTWSAVSTLASYRLRGMSLTRHNYPNLQPLAYSGDKASYGDSTYGDRYPNFLISIDSSKNSNFWGKMGNKEWCKQAYAQKVSYSSGPFGADAVFKYCSVSGTYPADREDWYGLPLQFPSFAFSWAM